MRKMFLAILALAGITSLFGVAFADDWGVMQTMVPEKGKGVSKAQRLRTADGTDPDTVWIGHIDDPAYTAGGKMVAGGYGPYHVGRGPNLPTRSGGTVGGNGLWSFDRYQPGETDSLQGWWPVTRPYYSTGGFTGGDFQRAFHCLDYGNQVNYVQNVGTAQKRTFGVVGLWHRDKGNTAFIAADTLRDQDPIVGGHQQEVSSPQLPGFSPTYVGGTGSTHSAWMGIRCHGDYAAQDKVTLGGTGNYINGDLVAFSGPFANLGGSVHVNGTDTNFPGYGSQMDQMLYRDIQIAENGGLNVSFNFSTNMSLAKVTNVGLAGGWFDKDPIVNAQNGVGAGATPNPDADDNFISAWGPAGLNPNAPCDSFTVYIGAPVNDNNVTFSDDLVVGNPQVTITTVYDKKRRWFSEVLRCNRQENADAGKVLYKELVSYAGNNPPTSISVNVKTVYPTLYADVCALDGPANGGKFRLVFRVHTNRGFDDQNTGNPSASFDSDGRGAALVDNVVVNGWAAAEGNFENETGTGAINNDTAVAATVAWKSTGKPPGVFFHIHPLSTLVFNDPCGGVDNPNRQCNLYGNIVLSGDHDRAGDQERGTFGGNFQERASWLASPTINLRSTGNGQYNAMGIDTDISLNTDITLWLSVFGGGLYNGGLGGSYYTAHAQSWPARQINGNKCWGDVRSGPSIFSFTTRACGDGTIPLAAGGGGFIPNSMIRTSNGVNNPDSLRVFMFRFTRCFSIPTLTDATCNPTTGVDVGVYLDNFSVALIDGATPASIGMQQWDLFNDAFPANSTDALVPVDFDTCAAHIRTGRNIAGNTGNATRASVAADTVIVTASGVNRRLDMIFRILPGVSNYVTKGNRATGVTKRPDVAGAATSGDGSFFGEYMLTPGQFTSSGSHIGHEGNWSPHKWNSARMDTVEANLFPTANNNTVVGLVPGVYMSAYHEGDPHFTSLGIEKWRCIMTNPAGSTGTPNVDCGSGVGPGGTAPGALAAVYTGVPASGFPTVLEPGATTIGKTKEYTKIIPDGLLTPGAHVQYFFRKSDDSNPMANLEYGPDTNFVIQNAEGSADYHRWQQFSILPDRWKDGGWNPNYQNAAGPACMLYIDWVDRRGDETAWVGIADTIGATSGAYAPCPGCVGADSKFGRPTGRWGSHNGWHASGTQAASDKLANGPVGQDPTIAVYRHGGAPGTIWDMYGVKAAESGSVSYSLANRAATAPAGFMTGKGSRVGPSAKMLRNFYRVLLILDGDLAQGNIGPVADKGDPDVGLINDFAATIDGTTRPRGIWVMGRAFVEGQAVIGQGHPGWTTGLFGAGLVNGGYRDFAGNANDVVGLNVFAPVHAVVAGPAPGPYGMNNPCTIRNDVLSTSGAFGAAMAAKYDDTGTGANPKIASIYAPSSLPATTHPVVTLVDGFRILSVGTAGTLQSGGQMQYMWYVMHNAFASLNCLVNPGIPVAVGDGPNGLVNFLALRSENPMRRDAQIVFGLTKSEMVELKVYDVTGRLVKTLANREFRAGQHPITWDGTNNDGQRISRGVYFYQLRTPSFSSQKKLVVLKE